MSNRAITIQKIKTSQQVMMQYHAKIMVIVDYFTWLY